MASNEFMRTQVVKITPDMAANWLTMNMQEQRRLEQKTVERYARAMKAGDWMLTHQGIAFDRSGKLIDGQHRLNAIIRAGVPVEMNVTYGVERAPGEILAIDVGNKRTIANVIQMSGYEDSIFQDIQKYVAAYMKYQMPGRNVWTANDIIRYIERHINQLRDVSQVLKPKYHSSHGRRQVNGFLGAAVICAYYRGVDLVALEKFCEVYRNNNIDGCEGYGVRHALNIRDEIQKTAPTREFFKRTKCAIRAFVENRRSLVVPQVEEVYPYYPEIDG